MGSPPPPARQHSSRRLNSELFDDATFARVATPDRNGNGKSTQAIIRHSSSNSDGEVLDGVEGMSVDGEYVDATGKPIALGAFGRMRAQGRIAAVSNAVLSAASGGNGSTKSCCILQPNGQFRRKWDIIMIFLIMYVVLCRVALRRVTSCRFVSSCVAVVAGMLPSLHAPQLRAWLCSDVGVYFMLSCVCVCSRVSVRSCVRPSGVWCASFLRSAHRTFISLVTWLAFLACSLGGVGTSQSSPRSKSRS